MKRILKTNWERYKNSSEGQEVIEQFNRLTTSECKIEDMLAVVKRFNPEHARNISKSEEEEIIKELTYYDGLIKKNIPQSEQEWENFKCGEFFVSITYYLAVGKKEVDLFEAPQVGFKGIIGSNVYLSLALFANMPDSFIPNLFVMQFVYFKKFAEKYELELPEIPKRSDYRMRWFYYLEMCVAIDNFAIENDLLDPGELCAFLFDYEMTNIKEEMAAEHEKPIPKVPENAWLLVGNYGEGEKTMKEGVWQSNQFTTKGDIMLFYEKSPVKKLNAVWTALEDGFIDPFGPYYSYSLIGNKIEIPNEQAVTFDDFKNSEYFQKRDATGNFVNKRFQGCSGWAVYYKDYAEIKRMLEEKGFNTSILPSLDEPTDYSAKIITSEEDVYNKLITPILEQMGWVKGKDFEREVEFAAGHTTTHHPSNKRPDYCLHVTRQEGKVKESKVVIEAKELFKGTTAVDECFDQCESYARWGKAKVIVICDKIHIFVYEQDRNGSFYKDKHKTTFTWAKLKEDEEFKKLKRKLDI